MITFKINDFVNLKQDKSIIRCWVGSLKNRIFLSNVDDYMPSIKNSLGQILEIYETHVICMWHTNLSPGGYIWVRVDINNIELNTDAMKSHIKYIFDNFTTNQALSPYKLKRIDDLVYEVYHPANHQVGYRIGFDPTNRYTPIALNIDNIIHIDNTANINDISAKLKYIISKQGEDMDNYIFLYDIDNEPIDKLVDEIKNLADLVMLSYRS